MIDNLQTQLANATNALSESKIDWEDLIRRDQAKAIQSTIKLYSRILEVHVLASHLMMDTERLIVKANPQKRWWRKEVVTSGPQIVSNRELKQMHRVHNQISDKVYEKLKKRSLEKQIPLTRDSILQVVRQSAAVIGAGAAATGAVVGR
ncbi:MAG: hypothetical protein F4227_00915 [Gammaproteobacteria bacterium]|nr:hypothetical protein [Gammaproteobacteria bacterium]MYF01571.1 hypothetical protein [Gammaproteobacteria bacterium]MYI78276.1 hypothetical protein [Gammaproteobacteria bacterium]